MFQLFVLDSFVFEITFFEMFVRSMPCRRFFLRDPWGVFGEGFLEAKNTDFLLRCLARCLIRFVVRFLTRCLARV